MDHHEFEESMPVLVMSESERAPAGTGMIPAIPAIPPIPQDSSACTCASSALSLTLSLSFASQDCRSSTSSSKSKSTSLELQHDDAQTAQSKVGMSVLTNHDLQDDEDEDEDDAAVEQDGFSLSRTTYLDLDMDSDIELKMIAEEIRADLRMQQLMEIAVVAERAAEAGHDSFTGLASTFGVDDGRNRLMKPLQMKRNYTYTEGQNIQRPFRQSHLERRAKRKVPVMALRHIEDLIPPMRQLHLHLRCHLHETGVDTENSLNDSAMIDLTLTDPETAQRHLQSASQERSFIQRMKRWVATSSLKGDFLEEKKAGGFEDGSHPSLCENESEGAFYVGDRLCAHITTSEVASGDWRPSPVQFPAGLTPPDEHDFEDRYATPTRTRKLSFTPSLQFALFDNLAAFPTSKTVQKLSAGENTDLVPKSLPPLDPSNCRRKSQDIVPVALFDSCDDQGGTTEMPSLKIRDSPKPFEIEIPSNHLCTPIAGTPAPEINLQKKFVTPAKLKDIRDLKDMTSLSRSSIWRLSRADSFRSDPGRTDSNVPFVAMDYDSAKSCAHEYLIHNEFTSGRTFLKPRGEVVNKVLHAFNNSRGETQAAGEPTYDVASWSSHHMILNREQMDEGRDNCNSRSMQQPFSGPMSTGSASLLPVALTREYRSGYEHAQRIAHAAATKERIGEPIDQTGTSSISSLTRMSHSKFTDDKHFASCDCPEKSVQDETQLIQRDSMQTPPVTNCRSCEFLSFTAASSTESDPGLKQKREDAENVSNMPVESSDPTAMTISLRRVTSCPSLADTCVPGNFIIQSSPEARDVVETKRSILKVFERLSPKSSMTRDRSILFSSKENHDYLNNYLYLSKPPNQIDNGMERTARPFCSDPCGTRCGDVDGGCFLLTSAADATMFLFQPRAPRRERDLLTFETSSSNDYSEFHKCHETWFDSATEKFGGALERLVGNSRTENQQWRRLFEAPTLNKKTPQSTRKVNRDDCDINDPRRVKGIILVQQSRGKIPQVYDRTRADEVFESMYGISRDAFRALTKAERFALWEERHTLVRFDESLFRTSARALKGQRGRKQQRTLLSSSDISLTP